MTTIELVALGGAAIAGLTAGGRWAASWHRSRRRSRSVPPVDVDRWYVERERRETLRKIAATDYRRRTRHLHDDEP